MAFLALFATLGTTFIMQKTTVVLGPIKVMGYIFLTPLCVATITLIFKGQPITVTVLPGMLLSLVATIILQFNNSDKAPTN